MDRTSKEVAFQAPMKSMVKILGSTIRVVGEEIPHNMIIISYSFRQRSKAFTSAYGVIIQRPVYNAVDR